MSIELYKINYKKYNGRGNKENGGKRNYILAEASNDAIIPYSFMWSVIMKKQPRQVLSVLLTLTLLVSMHAAAFSEETADLDTQTDHNGIIDSDVLNRWAESVFQDRGLNANYQDLSIGFCYTGTGDTWYWNADIWMYSASLYKVPVSMLMAEREAAGELTQESIVNGTTLEFLESTALVYSNNDSGHSMVSYLGGTYAGKCSDMTIKYTELPESYFNSDFIDVSYYTARYMTQVMKALYYGGAERFPHVVDYLLTAQPDAYYKSSPDFSQKYQIAQKYGSYEEPNGNNNNHCAAIIYTPTPIIVVVMTRNIMDYQNLIAQTGAYLAEYSLELDQKAEELRRAAAEQAARTEEETAPADDSQTMEQEMETATALEETESSPNPEQADSNQTDTAEVRNAENAFPILPLIAVLAAAAVVAIAAIVILSLRSRNRETVLEQRVASENTEFPEKKESYQPRH